MLISLVLTSIASDVDNQLSKHQLGISHANARTTALKVIGNYSPRVADLLQVMVLASSEMTFSTSGPPQTLEVVNVSVSMGFVEIIPQSVERSFLFKPPPMALNFDVLVVSHGLLLWPLGHRAHDVHLPHIVSSGHPIPTYRQDPPII